MAFKFVSNLKDNPNELALIFLRVVIGLMWLSEGLIKLLDRHPNPINDYHYFLQEIKLMANTNPFPFISSFINNYFVPNYVILAWIVILLEISLAISVIFGVFTRIGTLAGGLYAFILYISTLGWGDWPWSYFMIIMAMGTIFISSFQTRIGLDKIIYEKYKDSKIISLLI